MTTAIDTNTELTAMAERLLHVTPRAMNLTFKQLSDADRGFVQVEMDRIRREKVEVLRARRRQEYIKSVINTLTAERGLAVRFAKQLMQAAGPDDAIQAHELYLQLTMKFQHAPEELECLILGGGVYNDCTVAEMRALASGLNFAHLTLCEMIQVLNLGGDVICPSSVNDIKHLSRLLSGVQALMDKPRSLDAFKARDSVEELIKWGERQKHVLTNMGLTA